MCSLHRRLQLIQLSTFLFTGSGCRQLTYFYFSRHCPLTSSLAREVLSPTIGQAYRQRQHCHAYNSSSVSDARSSFDARIAMTAVFDKVANTLTSALDSQKGVPGASQTKPSVPGTNGLSGAHAAALDSQKAVPNGTEIISPTLPTLDRLGASLQADVNAPRVAAEWFAQFASAVSRGDTRQIVDLFIPDGWWRDHLALTWEFRTFHGGARIKRFLDDQLASFGVAGLQLRDGALLKRPYPDLAWIEALFDFETNVGIASGVFRLVPTATGEWKAFTLYTTLEDLKGFPEKIGPRREFLPNHGKWLSQREEERSFSKGDPTVLVVGGGQAGLEVAARLKMLDVPTLVIEKQNRIGDQWRLRYEALCLHDPVCTWYQESTTYSVY